MSSKVEPQHSSARHTYTFGIRLWVRSSANAESRELEYEVDPVYCVCSRTARALGNLYPFDWFPPVTWSV